MSHFCSAILEDTKVLSEIKKEFKLQARRFHIVANELVLPKLETVLQYIMSRQYVYILCRIGVNKKGKRHAHIYVAFERPVRLSTRNTHGCYLAKCRGDSKQNVTYINDHHPELVVALYKNGIRCQKSVHRLVAEAFIPNPDNKQEINHKNGIKNVLFMTPYAYKTSEEAEKRLLALDELETEIGFTVNVYRNTKGDF